MRHLLPLVLAAVACARPAPPTPAAEAPTSSEPASVDATATDLRDPGFDQVAGLPFAVGEPFDVVLPAADDGELVALSDYRGQEVALHIFGSW